MKILILTDGMGIGGAETHILTLIRELTLQSHEITLISSGGEYDSILKSEGVRTIFAPTAKRNPIALLRSKKIIKKEMDRCDIVHAHTRFTAFLATHIRGRRSYPPIVTTAHLNFRKFPYGRLTSWGDATLAVSDDIRQHLINIYKIPKERIILTKNGIDTSEFTDRRKPKKIIMHTSRLDAGRARTAELLIENAQKIFDEFPDYFIIIIGDGNRFQSLKRKSDSVNIALGRQGIIMLGKRSDINVLLSYARIFVGVSRAALEAMAKGIPTVISGDEGYGGIATFENYSLLSTTNYCARGENAANEDLLIKDIKTLLKDNYIYETTSEDSKRIVKLNYSSKSMVNDALKCYNLTRYKANICICGYFGFGNLGDEEILKSALNYLENREYYNTVSLVNTHENYSSVYTRQKFCDRKRVTDILRSIQSSDIILFAGGNLLQNETSFASLLYYCSIIFLSKALKRRVYIISSGFGKISGMAAKTLFKAALRKTDVCGCRTISDLNLASEINNNAEYMPDLALLLPEPHIRSEIKHFAYIPSSRKKIPTDDLIKIQKSKNMKAIAIIIFEKDDVCAIRELKMAQIDHVIIRSYTELTEHLSGAAFVLSERFHGAIFALLCHTHCFLTTDTEKNLAIINDVERYTSDQSDSPIQPYSLQKVLNYKNKKIDDSLYSGIVAALKSKLIKALNRTFPDYR